jgi:hypothetical protein
MNSGTKLVRDVAVGEFVRLYTESTMQYQRVMAVGAVTKLDGHSAPPDALVFVK